MQEINVRDLKVSLYKRDGRGEIRMADPEEDDKKKSVRNLSSLATPASTTSKHIGIYPKRQEYSAR